LLKSSGKCVEHFPEDFNKNSHVSDVVVDDDDTAVLLSDAATATTGPVPVVDAHPAPEVDIEPKSDEYSYSLKGRFTVE